MLLKNRLNTPAKINKSTTEYLRLTVLSDDTFDDTRGLNYMKKNIFELNFWKKV
jgi:hypothetical protein